jgi:hypothetical protein
MILSVSALATQAYMYIYPYIYEYMKRAINGKKKY